MMKFIISVFVVVILFSCGNNGIGVEGLNQPAKYEDPVDLGKTPLKDANGNFTAIIEIPAGTNHKYEYNYSTKSFECEIIEGKERVVNFLPYPGNYGFLPGTLMDKDKGGDGDALDVLVLGEHISRRTIVAIKPIATLRLHDRGEEDHKIIAVPVDPELNVLGITSFESLSDPVKDIVKTWFTSYKGPGKMEFQAWEGDSSTLSEIEKWTK